MQHRAELGLVPVQFQISFGQISDNAVKSFFKVNFTYNFS